MIKVKNYTLFYSVKDPLSNFYPCVFYYLGKPYLSVEHFYVTQKLIAMNCLNELAKLNACLKGSNFLNHSSRNSRKPNLFRMVSQLYETD